MTCRICSKTVDQYFQFGLRPLYNNARPTGFVLTRIRINIQCAHGWIPANVRRTWGAPQSHARIREDTVVIFCLKVMFISKTVLIQCWIVLLFLMQDLPDPVLFDSLPDVFLPWNSRRDVFAEFGNSRDSECRAVPWVVWFQYSCDEGWNFVRLEGKTYRQCLTRTGFCQLLSQIWPKVSESNHHNYLDAHLSAGPPIKRTMQIQRPIRFPDADDEWFVQNK